MAKYILFSFGFLLYANTIPFDFALDDKLAITHNKFTKQGFSGIPDLVSNDMFLGFFEKKKKLVEGGRYRPVSMVMFAIEWELFGPGAKEKGALVEKKTKRVASVGHLLNALFYGLTGVILYLVLLQLFPAESEKKWWLSLPFIATLIYLSHPLHTEVVANIKSRDEIMSVLFCLLSWNFLYKYLKTNNNLQIILSAFFLFLGLCSKESGVTFIGAIILSVMYFPVSTRKRILMAFVPTTIAAVCYLLLRTWALDDVATGEVNPELMNKPFLLATNTQWLATIIFTMGLYIKLLFIPHPLTHDYYPWHPLADEGWKWGNGFPYFEMSDPYVLISMVIYAGLIFLAIRGLIKLWKTKKADVVSFGILLFLGTFMLFSNLFFDIGAFMNERFMYVPSIGFAICISFFLIKIKKEFVKIGILGLLLTLYSYKTIDRNLAWKDDFTLSTTDVEVSSMSAKVNMSAGGAWTEKAQAEKNPAKRVEMAIKALKYLGKSLQLYPNYLQPMFLCGNAYYAGGDFKNSIVYFENVLKINPSYDLAIRNLTHVGDTLTRSGNFEMAVLSFETLLKYQPNNISTYSKLGELYGKNLRNLEKSEEYLRKAYELKPDDSGILQKLGVVYAIRGMKQEALTWFLKGLEVDPNHINLLRNTALIYRDLGNEAKSTELFTKADQLEKMPQ